MVFALCVKKNLKYQKWKQTILTLGTREGKQPQKIVKCYAKKIIEENLENNFFTVFNFTLKKSLLTKRIKIAIHPDGRVIVSAPKLLPDIFIRRFIKSKEDWIEKKLVYFKAHPSVRVLPPTKRVSRKDYLENKDKALALVRERLAHFNTFYNFEYRNVSIRNQKTRWGSCSRQKNLNFNYKIIFLSPIQQDYIVIHELCHLAQMNHGPNFWALVAQQIPEHKKVRASIKKYRL